MSFLILALACAKPEPSGDTAASSPPATTDTTGSTTGTTGSQNATDTSCGPMPLVAIDQALAPCDALDPADGYAQWFQAAESRVRSGYCEFPTLAIRGTDVGAWGAYDADGYTSLYEVTCTPGPGAGQATVDSPVLGEMTFDLASSTISLPDGGLVYEAIGEAPFPFIGTTRSKPPGASPGR